MAPATVPPDLSAEREGKRGAGEAATVPMVEQLIMAMPIEDLDRLARRYFSKSARIRARKFERNMLLLLLAVDRRDDAAVIARDVDAEINGYRRGAWRFDCKRGAPSDPRRAVLFRVLVLSNGAPVGHHTLRRLFRVLSKKASGAAHRPVAQKGAEVIRGNQDGSAGNGGKTGGR